MHAVCAVGVANLRTQATNGLATPIDCARIAAKQIRVVHAWKNAHTTTNQSRLLYEDPKPGQHASTSRFCPGPWPRRHTGEREPCRQWASGAPTVFLRCSGEGVSPTCLENLTSGVAFCMVPSEECLLSTGPGAPFSEAIKICSLPSASQEDRFAIVKSHMDAGRPRLVRAVRAGTAPSVTGRGRTPREDAGPEEARFLALCISRTMWS